MKGRIERAAIELFAARGVDGVSIADIAAAAGVAQGALYRHYRGKDELATQLFADAYLRTGTDLAAILAVRAATTRRVTAAGGITTREEIEELDRAGVDAVVGMAIYTGKLHLS